jgi:hypothetical protein
MGLVSTIGNNTQMLALKTHGSPVTCGGDVVDPCCTHHMAVGIFDGKRQRRPPCGCIAGVVTRTAGNYKALWAN